MTPTQDYKINLDMFEGPLDLLLHLIKKNDLDISNIPIVLILDQYLAYLEVMKELDIDVAGEFILMASELTHIKSKMALAEDEDIEPDEEDPRADLMQRLIVYQRYKNAAATLMERKLLGRDVFKRTKIDRPKADTSEQAMLEIDPFSLISTFNKILQKLPKEHVHEVQAERVSVTDRIYEILEVLAKHDSLLFEDLFENEKTKADLVITFLSVLEMSRLRMIQIFQTDHLSVIRVRRVMAVDEASQSLVDKDNPVDQAPPPTKESYGSPTT